MEHYTVETAGDGQEALKKGQANKYDLIVMDFMLPFMDGLEVCKRLRQDKIATPILLLTARDLSADWLTGQSAVVDDYLIKPFIFSEFLARIKNLLQSKAAVKQA